MKGAANVMRVFCALTLLTFGLISLTGCPAAWHVTCDFTATPRTGQADLTVQFQGTATGVPPYVLVEKFRDTGDHQISIVDWSWSFGDGSTGCGQNPTHVYTTTGCHTVILTVTCSDGTTARRIHANYVCVAGDNTAPVADAGDDQTAYSGDTIQLDGSDSFDPDGDDLTYLWVLVSKPAGSQASISDPTAMKPSFFVDRPGTYIFDLTVSDGITTSVAERVIITVPNTPPVADAGPDQTRLVRDTVTLDGSNSSDIDGDSLTFAWTMVSRPDGSAAALDDPTAVSPTFVVDAFGEYFVQLIVNDGTVDSVLDVVHITTANSAPVADAGPDQTKFVTNTVQLNGSGSSDVDGDPLTYAWSFVSRPTGSTAALSNAGAVNPTFVIDAPGEYVLQLVVNDGTVDSAPDSMIVRTENSPPVADAGPDRTRLVTETVQLDGSESYDVDGNALTYRWSFVSRPQGSNAALSDPTVVNPTFVIDLPGEYVVQLIVNDGTVDSAPDSVTITTENSPPVADAGPDQTKFVTNSVQLNGGGSSDVDGDPLTYAWSFASKPTGSAATLSDATAVNPTFVIDLPGEYDLQLIVNDGTVESAPDTVIITTLNSPPVADAGPDQSRFVTDTVTLDGSGSSDVDGDPLTYAWSLTSQPLDSTAVLSDPTAVKPTFVIDVPGEYVLQLVVNDAAADSDPDTVRISTLNSAPVADAGPDQSQFVTDTVTLDGSGSSDVDGDPLTYAWSFTSRPTGSAAVLSDPTAVKPTFVIDLPGDYVLQLIVNDGSDDSDPDTVTISTLNSPPVADAGSNQTRFVTNTVTLDGSGSSDVDGDPLTYVWSFTSRPTGSAASLNDPAASNPTFVIDLPGDYVLQLVVNDGAVDSDPDTVTISTLNSPPVADAGPDQSRFVTDTVTLDGSGSSDVDGDPLTYAWSFTSRPTGSTASLSDPTASNPTFVIDLPGDYVIQLIVNDGTVDSDPDTVQVSTLNSPPVADAGDPQSGQVGASITLDGSGSSDVDGDPLTFFWSFASRPLGSTAALDDPTAVDPGFVIDVAGNYTLQLIVNDGTVDSAPDTVQVSTDNSAPVADAGDPQTVAVGATATLDGSGSYDVDSDPLTYAWSFVSRPTGSTASLTGATSVSPQFTLDLPGDYVIQLIVNDGTVDSAPDTVTISTINSRPVADAGPDQRVSWPSVIQLDGSGSYDPDGDPITYMWSVVSGGNCQQIPVISDPTAMSPTVVTDTWCTVVLQLIVSDGVLESEPDTMKIVQTPN